MIKPPVYWISFGNWGAAVNDAQAWLFEAEGYVVERIA